MTDPITVAAIGAAATVAVCLITTAAPEIKQALRCRRTGRLFRKLNKALQCPEKNYCDISRFIEKIYDRQRRGSSLTPFQQAELARAEQIWSTL